MTADTPSPATLAPTALIDSDHPAVIAFAARARGATPRERAIALYYMVRDEFRYDPYRVDLSVAGLRASHVLECGYGWCVPKAALLAAAARAVGIPARVGYADVRNHLSTERLRAILKTDLYVWHGYTEMWLDGGDPIPAPPLHMMEATHPFPAAAAGQTPPWWRIGRASIGFL